MNFFKINRQKWIQAYNTKLFLFFSACFKSMYLEFLFSNLPNILISNLFADSLKFTNSSKIFLLFTSRLGKNKLSVAVKWIVPLVIFNIGFVLFVSGGSHCCNRNSCSSFRASSRHTMWIRIGLRKRSSVPFSIYDRARKMGHRCQQQNNLFKR